MGLLSFLTVSAVALAQNISDLEYFDRCFFLMTKSVPAANDPSLAKLKNKTITAPNACLEVLDRARLGSNNLIANPNDKVSKAVLRTFNDFHGSWFQSHLNPGGGALSTASALVRDVEEPALRITRALFGNDVAYKSILQGSTSYKGERIRTNRTAGNDFKSAVFFSYGTLTIGYNTMDYLAVSNTGTTGSAASDRLKALKIPSNRIIELGELVGISPNSPLIVPSAQFPNPADSKLPREIIDQLETNIDLIKNFGGGILGSQSFIFNNSNLTFNVKAETDVLVNRRISSRAFEDLMCHELPTLSPTDVPPEDIDSNSPQTFRRSASCMACHSQIDPFGYTYRNLVATVTSAGPSANNRVGTPLEVVRALPVVGTLNVWALQPPTGRLYYREFQANSPTRKNVANLEQMGAAMAASYDLYRCAAKRYYKYFTGVDVTLHKIEPPTPGGANYAKAKAKYDLDLSHQSFVMSAANEFRKHQSLRRLISDILNTPTFRSRDFLSTKETR